MKIFLVRFLFGVCSCAVVIFGYRILVDMLNHGVSNWWAFALVGTMLIIIGAFGVAVLFFGGRK